MEDGKDVKKKQNVPEAAAKLHPLGRTRTADLPSGGVLGVLRLPADLDAGRPLVRPSARRKKGSPGPPAITEAGRLLPFMSVPRYLWGWKGGGSGIKVAAADFFIADSYKAGRKRSCQRVLTPP